MSHPAPELSTFVPLWGRGRKEGEEQQSRVTCFTPLPDAADLRRWLRAVGVPERSPEPRAGRRGTLHAAWPPQRPHPRPVAPQATWLGTAKAGRRVQHPRRFSRESRGVAPRNPVVGGKVAPPAGTDAVRTRRRGRGSTGRRVTGKAPRAADPGRPPRRSECSGSFSRLPAGHAQVLQTCLPP